MWFLCRCLLLTVLLGANAVLATTLRVGLDPWPPFSGENLPNLGMSAEIISRVFQEAGYQTRIEILPWPRVEASVKVGGVDVMGNLYYVDDIAKWVEYSAPYYRSNVKFVALRDRHIRWTKLSDLKQYEIGVGNGYSFGEIFDHAVDLKKHPIPFTSNGMKMMLLGRLDMVIDSEEVIYYHLIHDLSADASRFTVLDTPVIVNPMSIGVNKDNPRGRQIIADFNVALERLSKNGTIKAIVERHISRRY